MIKKLLLVGEIFFGLILVLVIVVSVSPLLPPFKNYYHSRTVLTGSMEPRIPKGSVVINQWTDQKNLKVGNVITYQRPSRNKIIYITHRIVKIDKTGFLWRFKTKGDANPAADFGLVTQTSIEGKVTLTIPLVGYLIEFFKRPLGFVLLIALPLLVFIFKETRDVLQMWKKWDTIDAKPIIKRKRRKSVKRKIRKTLAATLVVLCFFAARVSIVTYASFTSGQATITELALGTAASFEFNPTSSPTSTIEPQSTLTPASTPTPEISPTPTPSPTPDISPTPTPTTESIPLPSTTPIPSPSPQPLPTTSPEPSPSPTPQPTSTPAPTLEPTPTLTPTPNPASEP